MRSMLFIVPVLLTMGCAAMLREVSPTPSPNYASLSFRAAGGSSVGEGGILDVDGHKVTKPQTQLYVARGRRSIGYFCPMEVVVLDGYWELTHEFEGGKRYELVCEKEGASIQALSGERSQD